MQKFKQKIENQTLSDGHDELFEGPMTIFEPIPYNVFTDRVYDKVSPQNDSETAN